MVKKNICVKRRIITILIPLILIVLFVINNEYHEKRSLEEKYNQLIGPVTEYLKNKYEEDMVIKEEIIFVDDAPTLIASPQNNNEISIRVVDWGISRGGFRDDYLKRHAEWDAKCIINPIIDKYYDNFFCYTILSLDFASEEILEEYYIKNKKHISWYDENHLDELYFAGIRIYGYDENLVEQNIIDPVLSDLLKLDFIIERVTFYLYKQEGDKEESAAYRYEYKDGGFQLKEIEQN